MEQRFSGQVFGITGYHNYTRRIRIHRTSSDEDIASKWIRDDLGTRLLFSFPTWQWVEQDVLHAVIVQNGGFIGNKHVWQHEQIIIVGDYSFDEEYLERSIKLSVGAFYTPEGDQIICKAQYFSAEAFVDFFENGEYPHYYHNDPRIRHHEGLSYLAKRGFKWPSIHAVPKTGNSTGTFQDRRAAHPLRSKYGYSVSAGLTNRERHHALGWAIQPNELGLEEVVNHIASLIRLSKLRTDRQNAIDIWETDLEWLYNTFYKNSPHSFIWPQ